MKKLPTLKICTLEINPPFILGGMGVRITSHNLVAAVSNLGMAGTIASVGLCKREVKKEDYIRESNLALVNEIRKTRKLTKGIVGVNIMVALTNYEDLVKTAVNEGIDYIISGAGLPLNLPEFVKNSKTCLIPIVSSTKAAEIICKKWLKKFNRLPDAFVVEGVLAGGHLGFTLKEISEWEQPKLLLLCQEVMTVCKNYEKEIGKHIPVIAAGGIFDGKDVATLLKIGVEGVQLATRFIATEECSVPANYKAKIIDSKIDDMEVIKSPVGLMGRAIRNEFTKKLQKGEKFLIDCPFHCLKTCEPEKTQFCIADVLVKAQEGDVENGLIMAGYNAYKISKVVSVKELVTDLIKDTIGNLGNLKC